MNSEFILRRNRWRWILPTLSVITISGAIAILLMSQSHILANVRQIPQGQLSVQASDTDSKDASPVAPEANVFLSSDQFSNAEITVISTQKKTGSHDPNVLPLQPETYAEDVSITACSMNSRVARPGDILTIHYTIQTPKDASVILGCSIRKAGTSAWINDSENDDIVRIRAGKSDYSRKFRLDSKVASGKYHVAWGAWSTDFSVPYDSKVSRNALSVEVSSISDDQPVARR